MQPAYTDTVQLNQNDDMEKIESVDVKNFEERTDCSRLCIKLTRLSVSWEMPIWDDLVSYG